MKPLTLSNRQARNFILSHQGLIGGRRFRGKSGVLQWIRQAGCLQYDPINICGRNADLVLAARVAGYSQELLASLLYQDRLLVDYFDKNLAIFPVDDWKYFDRFRRQHAAEERSHAEILTVCQEIKEQIRSRGPLSSADLPMEKTVDWYWSPTKLSRAALEHLYFAGELGIHHKKGTIKYYDLIERCLPAATLQASDPYPDDLSHQKWRVLRRIRAIGLLWNRASDAWLNIPGLRKEAREQIFSQLLSEGKIDEIHIDSLSDPFYIAAEDRPRLESVLSGFRLTPRCELLPPLDNLLWDRKLIQAVFHFDYKWEIYTPKTLRRYDSYVLPILYGNRFIGRLQTSLCASGAPLRVSHLWLEDGVRPSQSMEAALQQALRRLASLNQVSYLETKLL